MLSALQRQTQATDQTRCWLYLGSEHKSTSTDHVSCSCLSPVPPTCHHNQTSIVKAQIQDIQGVALTGRNTTGPRSRAGHWWVTLHIREVLQTTKDDGDRRQRAKQYCPSTLCVGGPVTIYLLTLLLLPLLLYVLTVFTERRYASAVYAVVVCPSVRPLYYYRRGTVRTITLKRLQSRRINIS